MNLRTFLDKYRVLDKEKPYTHTGLGPWLGKYEVPEEQTEQLYTLLHQAIFEEGTAVSLTEVNRPFGPIRLDLDFRYSLEQTTTRKHTEAEIRSVVQAVHRLITEYVNVPQPYVRAFVFERPAPYPAKDTLKDGIHIMYPYITVRSSLVHLIRKRLIEECPQLLGHLGLKNSFSDVVDEAVIERNPWLMYGCCKPGLSAYDLTHVYECDLAENDVSQWDHYDLFSLLSIHKPNTSECPVTAAKAQEYEEFLEKRRTKEKPARAAAEPVPRKRGHKAPATSQNLEEIQQLVSLLSPTRAEERQPWIEVGWCLHNLDDNLLETWIEFSKLCPTKFREGECERLWAEMRDEGLGIGSLHRWAKLDSPQGYTEVIRDSLSSYIMKSVSLTTTDVANVVHEMYKYQYVCVSHKYNTWYEFRNHRWHEIDNAVSLRRVLSNEVLNEYLRLISYYNKSAIEMADENKDQYLSKSKSLTDVTYKLRDYSFKDKIIKECMVMFYDEHFLRRLDSNVDLLGFENGIYDLKKGEFRDGRPEDMVSLTTGNDYLEFDGNEDVMHEIDDFLSKVFVDSELRDYVMTLLSSFLCGANKEQKFYIFTGIGGNGKSLLTKLVQLALGTAGGFSGSMSTAVLTQKKPASNQATPEVAALKGKRFVLMQELEEESRMNIALMKEWTGSDMIVCRPLFKEPIEFIPQFKMVLCCNHLPSVPPDDEGTWRRIRVIHFGSRFCDNPKAPNEFLIDRTLEERVHGWKEAFMYKLLQYYKIYMKNGLKEPACVTQATDDYRKDKDMIVEFCSEHVETDPTSVIKLSEAYQTFKDWHKKAFDGKAPNQTAFKAALSRKCGKYNAGPKPGWKGYRLVIPDVDGPALSNQLTEEQ